MLLSPQLSGWNMDKRQLAAQPFLDAVNGDNMTAEQARQIAISAWETAAIFDACEPKPTYSTMSDTIAAKLRGCRKCHGSGGKANDPCTACNGTGRVPA